MSLYGPPLSSRSRRDRSKPAERDVSSRESSALYDWWSEAYPATLLSNLSTNAQAPSCICRAPSSPENLQYGESGGYPPPTFRQPPSQHHLAVSGTTLSVPASVPSRRRPPPP